MMPTKERTERLKQLVGVLHSDTSDNLKESFPREKLGAKDIYSGGLVTFNADDPEGIPCLHPNIGKGGNESRAGNREEYVRELRHYYRDLWGKRGVAHTIQKREAAKGKKVSIRAIQQYMKDFP